MQAVHLSNIRYHGCVFYIYVFYCGHWYMFPTLDKSYVFFVIICISVFTVVVRKHDNQRQHTKKNLSDYDSKRIRIYFAMET